jgi:hypothetical protein
VHHLFADRPKYEAVPASVWHVLKFVDTAKTKELGTGVAVPEKGCRSLAGSFSGSLANDRPWRSLIFKLSAPLD